MQPFKVNRNSWHYKFNMNFMNAHGDYERGRTYWESKHNNFCSYWRTTFFRLVWAAVIAFGALVLVSFFGFMAYNDPIKTVLTVGTAIGVIMFIVGTAFIITEITERKPSDEAPKSLFVQKYIAYKSKVCPQVNYD